MYSIDENPFAVLGVSPRAKHQEIHDAVEDALFDAEDVEDERKLELARQALIAPNERLRAEVSFLLELRPTETRQALKSRDYERWIEIADNAIGLSKANAAVQAFAIAPKRKNSQSVLNRLLDGWNAISTDSVRQEINELRSLSGLNDVSRNDVNAALAELRDFHGQRYLGLLGPLMHLPTFMTDLVENCFIPDQALKHPMVQSLMHAYSDMHRGELAALSDKTLDSLRCYGDTGSEDDFSCFKNDLEAWDVLAQPLQLAHEASDSDEAHSKELYEKIRQFTLDLANDEDRHHEALQITKVCSAVFAELPWGAERLREDLGKLNEIIADRTRNEFLLPLATAVKGARDEIAETSHQLSSYGFQASSPDPVGAVWRSYAELLSVKVEQEVRDIGAGIVRGLAIELFNERQDALQAQTLTRQLQADSDWFSADLVKQIEDDADQLARGFDFECLVDAMKLGEWKRARELCTSLIAASPPSEVPQLASLQQVIDEKLRSRLTSRIVWGGLAAVVVGGLLYDELSGPSRSYEPAYDNDPIISTPSSPSDQSNALGNPAPEVGAEEPELRMPTSQTETMPPNYPGTLSLAQLRYCLRQGERLDFARDMVVSFEQQTRFNAAVSDFNPRCGSFRYDDKDMSIVRSELVAVRDQLRADARRIVGVERQQMQAPAAPNTNAFEGLSDEPGEVENWSPDEFIASESEPPAYDPPEELP